MCSSYNIIIIGEWLPDNTIAWNLKVLTVVVSFDGVISSCLCCWWQIADSVDTVFTFQYTWSWISRSVSAYAFSLRRRPLDDCVYQPAAGWVLHTLSVVVHAHDHDQMFISTANQLESTGRATVSDINAMLFDVGSAQLQNITSHYLTTVYHFVLHSAIGGPSSRLTTHTGVSSSWMYP